jgi:hypothetical protein
MVQKAFLPDECYMGILPEINTAPLKCFKCSPVDTVYHPRRHDSSTATQRASDLAKTTGNIRSQMGVF